MLEHTAAFYQLELHRHPEAIEYLARRGLQDPQVIEELGIGYAPGGVLRRHLPRDALQVQTAVGFHFSRGRVVLESPPVSIAGG